MENRPSVYRANNQCLWTLRYAGMRYPAFHADRLCPKRKRGNDAAPVASFPLCFTTTVASLKYYGDRRGPRLLDHLLLQSYAIDIGKTCAIRITSVSVDAAMRWELVP